MTFKQAQDITIERYRIRLNHCSECRARMHAHPKKRMICKWHRKNSIQATFDLFHEIGHIETYRSGMRRCESEYEATVWALDLCKELGLDVPDKTIKKYQDYIYMERSRGIRRHAENMPSEEELDLRKEAIT